MRISSFEEVAFETCYHFLSSLLEQATPTDNGIMYLMVQKLPAREGCKMIGTLPKGWPKELLSACATAAQVFEDMELGPVPAELDFWVVKQTLLTAFCNASP